MAWGSHHKNRERFQGSGESVYRVFQGETNSTSVLQVADLAKMLYNIKVLDQYVNRLTQQHCGIVREAMTDLIKDFSSPVREAFIDTLTVRFHIIYPSFTQLEIQRNWHTIMKASYTTLNCVGSNTATSPTNSSQTSFKSMATSGLTARQRKVNVFHTYSLRRGRRYTGSYSNK